MGNKVLSIIVTGVMFLGFFSSFTSYNINSDKKEIKAQYVDPGPGGG
ncbi:hypothetical protein P4485_22840 [Bacillus thuringiensis]|nr:hypothetical protein [Bacillus thuringiensis]